MMLITTNLLSEQNEDLNLLSFDEINFLFFSYGHRIVEV